MMIEKPTVIVLGAGASKPYGFPTGRELAGNIVTKLKRPDPFIISDLWAGYDHDPSVIKPSQDFVSINITLGQQGVSDKAVEPFRRSFIDSMQPSIDQFVQLNPKYSQLAKTMISHELLPLERPDLPFRDLSGETLWFEEFWKQFGLSVRDFKGSKLNFVTFNYDRSLEMMMLRAIQSSFDMNFGDAVGLLQHIPIHHVYGSLGMLPHQAQDASKLLDYGAAPDMYAIRKAVNSMRLIPDRTDNDELAAIQRVLGEAERICFLGFAFDPTNLDVLFGDEVKISRGVRVYGTAMGMGAADVAKTITQIKSYEIGDYDVPVTLGSSGQTSSEFLRSVNIWED